jgi:ketosteroid isomerase-like protein
MAGSARNISSRRERKAACLASAMAMADSRRVGRGVGRDARIMAARRISMTDDETAVVAANRAFYAAFGRRDFAALDRLWSRAKPVACINPCWDALTDRASVMDSWRRIVTNPGAPDIACRNEKLFVFGDVAFVICHEVLNEGVLAATNVFAREADGWRMVHHQASPLAMMPRETSVPPARLN